MPSLRDRLRGIIAPQEVKPAQEQPPVEETPQPELKQEEAPMPVLNEIKQEGPTEQEVKQEEAPMQEEPNDNPTDETETEDQEQEQEQQDEQTEEEKEAKPTKEATASKDDRPPKFALRKLVRKKITTKTGRVSTIAKMTNLDTFEGTPPTEDDIKTLYVPLHGGGKYLVVDMYSKKLVEKYVFPGELVEDEVGNLVEESAATAQPQPTAPVVQPQPQAQVAPQEAPPAQPLKQRGNTIEKLQMALNAGQTAAVDKLSDLADIFAEQGNMEGLNNVISALREIATGKRESTATDKLMEYLMTQQAAMLKSMFDGGNRKGDSMDEMMKFMGLLTKSKELFGGGEDTGVAMAREIGGVVKDSMDKVSDTVVQVTGSSALKKPDVPAERFVCSRCGIQVDRSWKVCPNCALVFKPGIIPPTKPSLKPTDQAEVFDKPTPEIPEEIKSKLGYLHNLAVFIQQKHDPERKATAFFKALSEEYQKGVLFLAQFGYDNLMRLAKPWKNSPEIPDRDIVFTMVESVEGAAWIKRFFKAVRDQAREDGVVLTDSEVEVFLEQINQYSPIKFHYKGPPKTEVEDGNASQQNIRQEVGTPVSDIAPPTTTRAPPQKVPPVSTKPMEEMSDDELHKIGMSRCFVCQKNGIEMVLPSKNLKEHLFVNHPRPGKPRERPPEMQPQEAEQQEEPPTEDLG